MSTSPSSSLGNLQQLALPSTDWDSTFDEEAGPASKKIKTTNPLSPSSFFGELELFEEFSRIEDKNEMLGQSTKVSTPF